MLANINKTSNPVPSVLIILVLFMLLFIDSIMLYAEPNKLKSRLTGLEEIPPVETEGFGVAVFQIDKKSNMKYQINVLNTGKVNKIALYEKKIGDDGLMLISLYQSRDISVQTDDNLPKSLTGITNKNIQKSRTFSVTGNFHDYDLTGPMKGKTIQDLIKTIQGGEVYINVHTEDYPAGEIRGQVIPEISTETGFQNK